MPGNLFLHDDAYAASLGYAMSPARSGGAASGVSHNSFMVWLVVYALAAILILGGLKVGGFGFVVRTR